MLSCVLDNNDKTELLCCLKFYSFFTALHFIKGSIANWKCARYYSNESVVGQIKFTTELVGLESVGEGRLKMRAVGEMDMGLLLTSVIIKVEDAVKFMVTIVSCHNFPCNFL